MKKIFLLAIMACSIFVASAVAPKDLKIYLNPGHGGYDSDDRNVAIAPFASGDSAGYWESKSNLVKGLALKKILESKGYKVGISRTTNTTDDDLNLSTIGALANAFGADMFLSIHSNATGTSARRNAPLMLYRGYDNEPVYPESQSFAEIVNKQLLLNEATVWTSTSLNVRGDWSFYTGWGDKVGLGVLRNLAIPGMLSEGSFHDYIPETYRLMSNDYCWVEAWHFFKAFESYFKIESTDTKGYISGIVYDNKVLRNEGYITYDRDNNLPLVSATVSLLKPDSTLVQKYTTSYLQNGFYLFRDVEPGDYIIKVEEPIHFTNSLSTSATAGEVTYANIPVKKLRLTPPEVISHTPNSSDLQLCNVPVKLEFNWDMDLASTEKAFSITPEIPGTLEWSEANYVLTFTPSKPYQANTTYTVKLDKSAKHAGGIAMDKDFQMSFNTDARSYLTELNCWPREGVEVHTVSPTVYYMADAPITSSVVSKNVILKDAAGTALSYNSRSMTYGKYNEPFGWAKLPVSKALTDGATYTLTVGEDVSDLQGIHLQNAHTYTFKAKNLSVAPEGGELAEAFDDVNSYAVADSVNVNAVLSKDTSAKLSGTGSMSVKYTFADNNASFRVAGSTSSITFSPADKLDIHIFGDMSNNKVDVILSAGGNEIVIPVGTLDYYGWQHKSINLAKYSSLFIANSEATFKAVAVTRTSDVQSRTGIVKFDNIYKLAGQGGVDEITTSNLTIYPNPTSEYIVASGESCITKLELYNLDGSKIAERIGNVINVSNINNGTYVVRIYTADNVVSKKVIVLHK